MADCRRNDEQRRLDWHWRVGTSWHENTNSVSFRVSLIGDKETFYVRIRSIK